LRLIIEEFEKIIYSRPTGIYPISGELGFPKPLSLKIQSAYYSP
jgi:hypothetical protein